MILAAPSLIALVLAAALQTPPTPAPDRSTWAQLVECAAVFRIAGAVAGREGDESLKSSAVLAAVSYDVMAYRYGRPLDITDAATDAAVRVAFSAQSERYSPMITSAPQLARQAMNGDQRVCQALSERLVRETAEAPAG